jgi:hypothetical protein
MTETLEATTTKPAPDPSFWEDLIDIFFAPVGVFRRWAKKSAWPPLLFDVIAIAIISFFTFNTLEPIFEAEFDRNAAAQMAASKQKPTPQQQEAMAGVRDKMVTFGRYFVGVGVVINVVFLGIGVWLLGKLVGAATTFGPSMGIAAWAYMPRVLGSVAGGIQGLLMDPASFTSLQSITLGPGRFMSPDTSNPLLFQVAGRLDLFIVWETILLGVGLYAAFKIPKSRAAVFALLIWFVGTLPNIRNGLLAM